MNKEVMSKGYWALWNDEVQARIDRDIDAHRKADASLQLEGVTEGVEVRVEQLDHAFVFGSHIFNFNQLGTEARNTRYKELFGTLFNSATIPFYWSKFEPEEGHPRFKGEHRDTEAYWNTVEDPQSEAHWRRPATDPLVEFCEAKGIRCHGHTFIWGNCRWHMPEWLLAKLPSPYREQVVPFNNACENATTELFKDYTPAQIEALLPDFTRILNTAMAKRIIDCALHYKTRIQSWDVVNESAMDYGLGNMIPEDGICKSHYGLLPGDYDYRSLKIAESVFPKAVNLNINDYKLNQDYVRQIKGLLERGCKIDVMGAQMHLFNPQDCLDIAEGKPGAHQAPKDVRATMDLLETAGRPIHLSEITITAPNNDERGQAIQAIITRNLYRLWFSVKSMMGITWWNTVDGCGAPGEPSVSGLFTRDMQAKPACHALNDLINREWKTDMVVQASEDGRISFRGFRGNYRLSWTQPNGEARSVNYRLG